MNNEKLERAKLALKLAQVSNELTGMMKDGRNEAQKFSFIGYEQINAYISKYLLKFKVMIIPEITESEKTILEFEQKFFDKYTKKEKTVIKRVTTVSLKMNFDIIDAETGYMMSKKFEGESSDYNDKAFPKATTEVQKRFYAKLFNITSGELDADKDTVTIEKEMEVSNKNTQFRNQVLHLANDKVKQKSVTKLLAYLKVDKLEQVQDKKAFLETLENELNKIQLEKGEKNESK